MTQEMKYDVWMADLNSLYLEQPRPPILAHSDVDLDTAVRLVKSEQTNDIAAWITLHGTEVIANFAAKQHEEIKT